MSVASVALGWLRLEVMTHWKYIWHGATRCFTTATPAQLGPHKRYMPKPRSRKGNLIHREDWCDFGKIPCQRAFWLTVNRLCDLSTVRHYFTKSKPQLFGLPEIHKSHANEIAGLQPQAWGLGPLPFQGRVCSSSAVVVCLGVGLILYVFFFENYFNVFKYYVSLYVFFKFVQRALFFRFYFSCRAFCVVNSKLLLHEQVLRFITSPQPSACWKSSQNGRTKITIRQRGVFLCLSLNVRPWLHLDLTLEN